MSSNLYNEWQNNELAKHITDDYDLNKAALLSSTMGGPVLMRGPSQLGMFAHSNKKPNETLDNLNKPKLG